MEDLTEIKEWLYPDGILNTRRLSRVFIKKRFPVTYQYILDNYTNYNEGLYCVLNNIKESPICKNCSNKVNFKNFTNGYRIFCSNKCVNEFNSKSKSFASNISNSKSKSDSYYIEKYGYKKIDGKFLYNGELIDRNMLLRIINSEYIDTKEYFIKNWDTIKLKTSKSFIKRYFPNVYLEIIERYNNKYPLQEMKYMYINDMDKPPVCEICNKNPKIFNPTNFSYGITCNSLNCRKSSSNGERELYDFVKSNTDFNIINNYRHNNNELDIYIPELNMGIEYNGIYWHSTLNKDKLYHQTKRDYFKDLGINVMFVWEDDWVYNKELIKSMILHKLGNSTRIFARNTIVKSIDIKQAREFHNLNHLRKSTISSINYGLFYNDELMSCISIGKSRFNKNELELHRFSTKIGHTVVGGFSKMMKLFIVDNPNIKELISYADADFSDGNLYMKNGFEFINKTEPNFYLFKGNIRYSRQVLWDKTKNKKDYLVIYDTGNLKYKYKIK